MEDNNISNLPSIANANNSNSSTEEMAKNDEKINQIARDIQGLSTEEKQELVQALFQSNDSQSQIVLINGTKGDLNINATLALINQGDPQTLKLIVEAFAERIKNILLNPLSNDKENEE